MCNEWRENIWLTIGLAIVTIAIWLLGLNMNEAVSALTEPLGFDPENVVIAKFAAIPEESQDRIDYGDKPAELYLRDRKAILAEIRRSPYVEAVGIGKNALPYFFNFYGTALVRTDVKNDTLYFPGNMRVMSPDMAKVLRLQSLDGKSVDQLSEILSRGDLLVSEGMSSPNTLGAEELKGHILSFLGDSINRYRAAGLINTVKRGDFEPNINGTIIIPLDEDSPYQVGDIAIRVKSGCVSKFMEEMHDNQAMRRYGNTFVKNIQPLASAGKVVNKSEIIKIRFTVIVMSVFLLIIFLGLLGTFWFRVQQRVKEIAIRKVCGATSGDIMRRIMGEGLLLLMVATMLAAAVGWPLITDVLNKEETVEKSSILIYETLTLCVMAIGILLSIWLPARKAMAIEPAIAIKEE